MKEFKKDYKVMIVVSATDFSGGIGSGKKRSDLQI